MAKRTLTNSVETRLKLQRIKEKEKRLQEREEKGQGETSSRRGTRVVLEKSEMGEGKDLLCCRTRARLDWTFSKGPV